MAQKPPGYAHGAVLNSLLFKNLTLSVRPSHALMSLAMICV